VGNSQSYVMGDYLVTPRGYEGKNEEVEEQRGRGAEEQGSKSTEVLPHNTTNPSPRHHDCDVYPISIIGMAEQQAVVVGGGPVGQRKVEGLLAAGLKVRLISPEATPELQAWAEEGRIQWQRRPYQPGDMSGAQLVFAATNQRAVNAQVAQEAKNLRLLCNVADQPDEGNFYVPAVHRQPGLVVAVSSRGESPRRAQKVRDQIAGWLHEE
jgi:cobalt-precorrin 5A hydrolase/precorrin-3B C17-methyltransferase